MTLLLWPDFKLFPYEYDLARREAQVLLGATRIEERPEGLIVDGVELKPARSDAFTYFSSIVQHDCRRETLQSRVESIHRQITGRRGAKQSTRYLVHDLHEYKGKFNPQMARALINVFGAHADIVIDPFSGSGTTAVEAARLGKGVVALDMNPLAAWMSAVKTATLTYQDPSELQASFERLATQARTVATDISMPSPTVLRRLWDEESLAYLERWFPGTTLWPMARVLDSVYDEKTTSADLVRLAVSNVVRTTSWQLPEDLRVRRRPPSWTPPIYANVLGEALRRVSHALVEQTAVGVIPRPEIVTIEAGDARAIHEVTMPASAKKVVITSPPYATALPYIDTDRLSLVALSLIRPTEVKSLESDLTGSREWSTRVAAEWGHRLAANSDRLPPQVVELCNSIRARNDSERAGFRRQAVPALLYRYFHHMTEALRSWAKVLRPGENAVLVVGSNRTGGRSEPILIDTPDLIGRCGEAAGFSLVEKIPFQVWARYGMHAKNGVEGESAVVLRRGNY